MLRGTSMAPADGPLVFMVSMDVPVPLPGVTLFGNSEQEADVRPAGNPQFREILVLNVPPWGETVTVYAADCPALMVVDAGVAMTEKSTPVPARPTLRGLSAASSVMIRVAIRFPSAEGVNDAPTVHVLPGVRTVPAQLFVGV